MVTLDNAKEVAQRLVDDISPVAVIVFGSVARNMQGEDLDILVVLDLDDIPQRVGTILRDYYRRFAIDYIVASADDIWERK